MGAFTHIAKTLLQAGEDLKEILIAELMAQNHIASGKLVNSFDVDFKVSGDALLLEINNKAGYAIAVDEGLSAGTVVGVRKLIKWVKQKAARGFLRASTEQAVLIIAKRVNKSIRERGTVSPKGFIGNAMDTANRVGLFTRIADATGLEVDGFLGESEIDATITVTITA